MQPKQTTKPENILHSRPQKCRWICWYRSWSQKQQTLIYDTEILIKSGVYCNSCECYGAQVRTSCVWVRRLGTRCITQIPDFISAELVQPETGSMYYSGKHSMTTTWLEIMRNCGGTKHTQKHQTKYYYICSDNLIL